MTAQERHVAATFAALYRGDLKAFVMKVFATLHGRQATFVDGWYIDAMCKALEDVWAGREMRLVITVPPRHLKSITVAVAFTAFLLGHNPRLKIIVASYGLDLARKHAADCRRVMESDWYKAIFRETRLGRRGNTTDEIKTTLGGGRKAVSIGGAVTGHGCDVLIIDDLLKAADAESEAELWRAQEFMDASLLSRFDNPAEGKVICIQQRLHEADPAGHLLNKGTYRHLNLPAIGEVDEEIPLLKGRTYRRRVGDLLAPERLSKEDLDRLRKEMGSATFNCQYQQNPIAPDGSVLRWEWFGTYDERPPRERFELVVQSWDTAMSSNPRAAFSACTTWGFKDRKWWLLDAFRGQLEYPELRKMVLRHAEFWRADKVLIEEAASGRPLISDCHMTNRARFRAIKPEQDKVIRFNSACSVVEAGDVLLPKEASWMPMFRRELMGFPRATLKDQADSFSQFLNWTKGVGFRRSLPRHHPILVESRERSYLRRR